MAENLRSIYYNDGTPIELVTDDGTYMEIIFMPIYLEKLESYDSFWKEMVANALYPKMELSDR